MSVVKRTAALVLALLMIVATGSVMTLQTVYAEEFKGTRDETIMSINPTEYTSKVTVVFEVQHQHYSFGGGSVKKTSTVSMNKDSDFRNGTLEIKEIISTGVTQGIVKYQVIASGIEVRPGRTGSSLNLKVQVTEDSTKYDSGIITLVVPGYNDGSIPDPDPTPPPVTPSAGNAGYRISRVMASKRVGDNDVPNTDRKYFDKNNITSSSDPSMRQTYFADITLLVYDKEAPSGLDESNIKGFTGLGASSLDLGSFTYRHLDSNTDIKLNSTGNGYYEIVLKGVRYSGNGKKINLRVEKDDYIHDITSEEITECITKKEAAAESDKNNNDDDDSKLEVETPYVIVNKYSYGGGNVTAGDTFPLNLTIYNTSETEIVSNMMITMTMPEGLMLTSSSNTFYVEELDKHASINKTVQVTAKADAKAQSHNVVVAMKYQYVDDRVNARRSAETTENIAIPVVQVDRFQVTAVEIPMEVMLGEETSVTVNYVNKGRSEAYNLSAEIDGNIQNPGQNQNLGNLASGATGSADFFILPNDVGMCSGEIKISYEDTNMEEKTATIRYNTTVKSPEEFMGGNNGMMVGPGGMMPGEGEEIPEEGKKPGWPIIAGGAVIVAVPVLIVVKKKLDAKRKEREDADL